MATTVRPTVLIVGASRPRPRDNAGISSRHGWKCNRHRSRYSIHHSFINFAQGNPDRVRARKRWMCDDDQLAALDAKLSAGPSGDAVC